MIERRMRFFNWFFNDIPFARRNWHEIPIRHLPPFNYVNFEHYYFRVNGTVYNRNTARWREALNKERLWAELNKG